MSRSIDQIQEEMIQQLADEGITVKNSRASRRWLWTFVVSACIHTLEQLFDILKNDTDTAIKELKPHNERWYANKAKAYQHGFILIEDSDLYDNSLRSPQQIAQSKVVKYSAVIERPNEYGRVYLRIKLAGHDGNDLQPLTTAQLGGVREYFKRIKDAGVPLLIESNEADSLKMKWTIYYDPLILSGNGSRLDGQDSGPVPKAIKNYLQNLPFNGTFVPQYVMDEVQDVEGVVICQIENCQAKYGNLNYSSIGVEYTPDAGYLRFEKDTDLIIDYIARSEIR